MSRTLILALTLKFLLYSTSAAAQEDASAVGFKSFQETIHPFLIQNCVKCHSEKSVYPVGPAHSHSNVQIAFREFQKRVNLNNIEKSRFWRLGLDQHYCKEHGYECKKMGPLEEELKLKLKDYAQLMNENKVDHSQSDDGRIDAKIVTADDDPSDIMQMAWPLTDNSLKNDPYLLGQFRRIGQSDFFILSEFKAIGIREMYRLKGLHFLVNGQELSKRTGYENTDRILMADGLVGLERPIIELKAKDVLSIKVDFFEEIDEFPSRLCHGSALERFKKIINIFSNGNLNEEELCLRFESEIDFHSFRRSVLLARTQVENSFDKIKSWIGQADTAQVAYLPPYDETFRRGKYLYKATGCANCHGRDLSGGAPFNLGKDGIVYASNITSHVTAGIGYWTDNEFVAAVREGVSPKWSSLKGKYYYPVFPYTSYSKMSRKDVIAIKRYIEKFEPSSKKNISNEVKGPASFRDSLTVWNFARQLGIDKDAEFFVSSDEFVPLPSQTESWNKGAYLVNAVLHCAQCHSPREESGMARGRLLPYKRNGWQLTSVWLKGGMLPTGKKVPDITKTPDSKKWPTLERGASESKKREFKEEFLSIFEKIDYDKMQMVYQEQLKHLTPDDLSAVGEYLNKPDPFK